MEAQSKQADNSKRNEFPLFCFYVSCIYPHQIYSSLHWGRPSALWNTWIQILTTSSSSLTDNSRSNVSPVWLFVGISTEGLDHDSSDFISVLIHYWNLNLTASLGGAGDRRWGFAEEKALSWVLSYSWSLLSGSFSLTVFRGLYNLNIILSWYSCFGVSQPWTKTSEAVT